MENRKARRDFGTLSHFCNKLLLKEKPSGGILVVNIQGVNEPGFSERIQVHESKIGISTRETSTRHLIFRRSERARSTKDAGAGKLEAIDFGTVSPANSAVEKYAGLHQSRRSRLCRARIHGHWCLRRLRPRQGGLRPHALARPPECSSQTQAHHPDRACLVNVVSSPTQRVNGTAQDHGHPVKPPMK